VVCRDGWAPNNSAYDGGERYQDVPAKLPPAKYTSRPKWQRRRPSSRALCVRPGVELLRAGYLNKLVVEAEN